MEQVYENSFEIEDWEEGPEHHPHEQQVWIWKKSGEVDADSESISELVKVLSISKDHKFVTVLRENGDGEHEVETFPAEETFGFDPASHTRDWDNVAQMNNLHEPAMLDLLRRRYFEDKIYTLSGDIVISVNPYKSIVKLYDKDATFRKSAEQLQQELAQGEERSGKYLPHLFSVAESAFEASAGENQSILINGESGAGKTEASKHIMRFLTWKSEQMNGSNELSPVEQSVLQSNPLLEAFGNAQTIRNDNSSRFGKFVKIEYNQGNGTIKHATTQHFLLEKSRLVRHSKGERNYHVFYQLCRGLDKESLGKLGLTKDPSEFAFLVPSHDVVGDVKTENRAENEDAREFENTLKALQTIGCSSEQIFEIWKVLAGVLHLGNIEFVASAQNEEHASLNESNPKCMLAMQKTCELLGMELKDLKDALVTRTMGGKASVYTVPLTPKDARHSRNALAKAIYSKLFDHIVSLVNKESAQEEKQQESSRFIGILDIFGFEILAENSFEQLCVNYANEVLQKLFNEHVFELEKSRYENEGIEWKFLSFANNQALIDVIDGPRTSVLALLEEQGMLGSRASDSNYLAQLAQQEKNHFFTPDRFGQPFFTINHFAGPVQYKVEGFLAKNNDALQGDLSDLMVVKAKKNAFIQQSLFPMNASPIDMEKLQDSPRRSRKMANLQSVSDRFRSQMSDLVNVLRGTRIHFVRCVKPNEHKEPGQWNGKLVLNQLRHLGVMEAVRIRQEGYPVSRSFKSIVETYSVLFSPKSEDLKQQCQDLLQHVFGTDGQDKKLWQMGQKEKVFLQRSVLPELNMKMQAHLQEVERIRLAKEEEERKRQERERLDKLERERLEREDEERRLQELERIRNEEETQRALEEQRIREEEERQKRLREEEELRQREEEERINQMKALAEKHRQLTESSATKIQAWWRALVTMDRFASIKKARWPWRAVLNPNEAVLLASLVVHTSKREIMKKVGKFFGVSLEGLLKSKKRRGLILTTGRNPRLLVVDPKNMTVLSTRPVLQVSSVEILSDKSFVICETGTDEEVKEDDDDWSFTDILGRSAPWARALKRPISVSELMTIGKALRLDSTEPVLLQGYMKKRAIKSQMNWRERWFVLQGSDLMWYKSQKQSTPQGTLKINDTTTFQLHMFKDRPHSFSIHSPDMDSDGLFIQCPSKRFQCQWLAALTGIKATNRFYDENSII